VDQSAAQVEAAKAAIETAQINLDYCYIHSPIDGRAGARLVDVGNVVQANLPKNYKAIVALQMRNHAEVLCATRFKSLAHPLNFS